MTERLGILDTCGTGSRSAGLASLTPRRTTATILFGLLAELTPGGTGVQRIGFLPELPGKPA